MRRFIHLSVSGLLACLVIAATGCQDSGDATLAPATASHSDDGHDHDGEAHDQPLHGGEHKHGQTYDAAVAELLVMHKVIADGFATGDVASAHGPLHHVGHALEVTETAVENSDMDDDTKQRLHEAIEQLSASYGAVDDKMHLQEDGKDYSDVAEQIEQAINTLKSQTSTLKQTSMLKQTST